MVVKVAVVGSGISGIGASWLLGRHGGGGGGDQEGAVEVTLFEQDDRLGGHTNTVETEEGVRVDTGFIVFNRETYPNFVSFLETIGVGYEQSDMSFSVSRDRGAFEWAGTDARSLFAQPSNVLSSSFWRMLLDVLRFNASAPLSLLLNKASNVKNSNGKKEKDATNVKNSNVDIDGDTIGGYLAMHAYSRSFVDDYLVPMTAAIWSTPPDRCLLEFPTRTLVRFMFNHGLLQIANRPQWLTISNGARSYIDAVLPAIHTVNVGARVVSIQRQMSPSGSKVRIVDADGTYHVFDYVIMAVHGDHVLPLLGNDATKHEKAALRNIRFSENKAVLHRDPALMPSRKSTWSSWNYLTTSSSSSGGNGNVCLTYWMNKLQNISPEKHGHLFVTMNPLFEPDAATVLQEFTYHHPLYNNDLINAQKEIQSLNVTALSSTHTLFAGAWTKYGFHEDGLTSGLRAAALILSEILPAHYGPMTKSQLDAKVCPFKIKDASRVRDVNFIEVFAPWVNQWRTLRWVDVVVGILGTWFTVVLVVLDVILTVAFGKKSKTKTA